MRVSASLQTRLALAIGLCVTGLWLVAATLTAHRVSAEMEDVFNDGLKATAQRLLPIVRHDLRERHLGDDSWRRTDDGKRDDDDDDEPRSGREARYGENVTFILRDASGRVLYLSKRAELAMFPPFTGRGFVRTATHQLYEDVTADGNLSIAVAEPLEHRNRLFNRMQMELLLPLLVVIPFSLVTIVLVVRRSLRPVRGLRQELARRGAQDLSPLRDDKLPGELRPISAGINQLLNRLTAAFHAERAFAANAAHELRTPVAGAIAQAQRIRAETSEAQTSQRATEIEVTLKRLMRMSEKLMQLARAEGGRLQGDEPSDLRAVLQMIVQDFTRVGEGRIVLSLPSQPVLSRLDPDAVGILFRNLLENALKHGAQDGLVEATLKADGVLCVANDGPVLPPAAMDRLMQRFERGEGKIIGSGLGLSIIKAITERTGMTLRVISPRPADEDDATTQQGVQVEVRLPLA